MRQEVARDEAVGGRGESGLQDFPRLAKEWTGSEEPVRNFHGNDMVRFVVGGRLT